MKCVWLHPSAATGMYRNFGRMHPLHRTATLLYWAAARLRLLHIIVLRPSHSLPSGPCYLFHLQGRECDTRQLSNGQRGPIPFPSLPPCQSWASTGPRGSFFVGKGCQGRLSEVVFAARRALSFTPRRLGFILKCWILGGRGSLFKGPLTNAPLLSLLMITRGIWEGGGGDIVVVVVVVVVVIDH